MGDGTSETRGRVIFRADDGSETDVTNAVTVLWDGVIGSLDWGSGWWDAEDAGAVAWIGKLLGFDRPRGPYDISGRMWSVEAYVAAIALYEKHRAEIDANLPPLP